MDVGVEVEEPKNVVCIVCRRSGLDTAGPGLPPHETRNTMPMASVDAHGMSQETLSQRLRAQRRTTVSTPTWPLSLVENFTPLVATGFEVTFPENPLVAHLRRSAVLFRSNRHGRRAIFRIENETPRRRIILRWDTHTRFTTPSSYHPSPGKGRVDL